VGSAPAVRRRAEVPLWWRSLTSPTTRLRGPELAFHVEVQHPHREPAIVSVRSSATSEDRTTDQLKDVKHPLLTSSFRDRDSAERAYNDIVARGYKDNQTHVLMSDETRKLHYTKDGEVTDMGNKALKGGSVGGVVGGAVGATVVGLAAAAGAVTVPVLGLVIIGPVAGALAGGAAGATGGGFVGMLVGAGIPEARAKGYETDLKNGGNVLGVSPRNDVDARYFETEWQGEEIRAWQSLAVEG